MKSFLKLLIISALIGGLTIPSLIFDAPELVSASVSYSSATVYNNTPLSVISNPFVNFSVSSGTNLTVSCSGGVAGSSNFVQDTGLINLNQTVNCFSIRNASLGFQPRLQVAQANIQAVVIVKKYTNSISRFLNLPVVPQANNALPVSLSLVLLLGLAYAVRVTKSNTQKLVSHFIYSPTLSQLQVMRC